MAEELAQDIAEQPSLPIEPVEPSAPVDKSEPKEPKAEKPLSTRETIKAAIKEEADKAERARAPDGKFAKEPKEKTAPKEAKEPKAAVKEISATEPVKTTLEPSKVIEAPKAWPKDKHAVWNGLPQEAKDFLLKREEQVSNGFAQYENLGPIKQTVEKHTPYFQQMGVHPSQYIENAVSWDRAFRDPQTRDRAIQEFAQSYGINLSTLAPISSEPQQIPAQLQPIVQQFPQLTQTIQSLQNQVSGFQNERIASEIETFKKDHPHFEKVRNEMGSLIQASAQFGQTLSLNDAYDRAIWTDKSIRDEMMKADREKHNQEAIERAKNAHKAAVSAPSRAPVGATNGTGKKGNGVRDSIKSAIEEVRERDRA